MVIESVLNLKLDSTNEEVRTALLKLCTKNTKLKNFINRVFREYEYMEISAFDDYGWEWDIECYGVDGANVAMCNHDFRDDDCYDGNGWELSDVPTIFSKYFSDSFKWDNIRLDNGKLLLLTDECDYLAFHIVDYDKMEDGKVDFYGINWF